MKSELLIGAALLISGTILTMIGWFLVRIISQYDRSFEQFKARLDLLNSSVIRDVDRRVILLESRMDAAFEILHGKRKIRND